MATNIRTFAQFMGLMTSVDSAQIPDGYAQDMLNVRIEDGKLRIRYGNSVATTGGGTAANITSSTAGYGFDYTQGYNVTTLAEVEEFVVFAAVGGNVRAYGINPTTHAQAEIKNGVSSVNLNASAWRATVFEDTAYFVNANNTVPVYSHLIADATSLTAISAPAKPTAALTFRPKYSSTSYTTYDRIDFTGITFTNATHCACSGSLDWGASANTAGALNSTARGFRLGFVFPYNTSPGQGYGSAIVDLTAGGHAVYDWTYNDVFSFVLRVDGVEIDPGSIKFSVVNADGSPITVTADELEARVVQDGATGGTTVYHVWARFKNKTRAEWDNIKKIKLEATYIDGTGFGVPYLSFDEFYIGCVACEHLPSGVSNGLNFSYSYQVAASAQESERVGKYIGTTVYELFVSNDTLEGKPGQGMNTRPLGAWIEFGITASSEGAVDMARLYAREQNGLHVVVTQSDATTTYLYRMTIEELRALSTAVAAGGTFASMKYAVAFKGWMIWLKKGGSKNVLHSRIGAPLRLSSDLDTTDDELRGSTWTMADNAADEPVCGFQAGDAFICLGSQGVYAQVGNSPSTMGPLKKIPGSLGVANQFAACRWKDEEGNPGVAFVSKNGEGVYFVQVDQSFDGDQGFRIKELSRDIRPTVLEYITPSTAIVSGDESGDTLWVWGQTTIGGTLASNALVLRRVSMIDNRRGWERYRYTGGFSYISSSTRYRIRGLGSVTGVQTVYEIEWSYIGQDFIESSVSGFKGQDYAAATGQGCFWHSGTFIGRRRRVGRVQFLPETPAGGTNGPSWTFYVVGCDRSDAVTSIQTPVPPAAGGTKHIRFGFKCQGQRLSYRLNFNAFTASVAPDDYIEQIDVEEIGPVAARVKA